ncbi:MAG: hypothetical protein HY521_01485 [Proteobacteria bacterium]|nr:hypothetical protein [Pseudomonadota bacterium]
MKVSAELIRDQAKALHDIELTEKRAKELAAEVERLNANVARAAREHFDFDDDPGAFPRILSQLKG